MGLFGNFGSYGVSRTMEIRDVELRNVDVTGGENVGGLVGYSGGGSIKNSSVTGGSVTGDTEVGGLVGSSGSEIMTSNAENVTVSGRNAVGGLVGHSLDPITNSHASGNVSGEDDVGGLVGRNDDDITSSYATGDVTGTETDPGSSMGGLVGTHWYDRTISNSYATGNVTGKTFVGGLVGMAWGGNIQTSYATGDVTGVHIETTFESDGETLVSVDPSGRVGGLMGSNRGATISTSFATGAVTGMHHIGGLVGENQGQTIRATYAWGDVTATGAGEGSSCQSDRDPGCRIGGLVGTNIGGGGAIINSYAIGQLIVETSHQRVGGLAGESPTERLYGNTGYVDPGSITASYWDTETSEIAVGAGTDDENNNRGIDPRNLQADPPEFGETEQDGVDGKTTSELQTPTGYMGIYETWDDSPDLDLDGDSSTGDANGKDAPWYFGTASDYPVLRGIDANGDGVIHDGDGTDTDNSGAIDEDERNDDLVAQEPGPKSPRVTVVSVSGITQTGATVTVNVAHPSGSTVYMRYKADSEQTWRKANKAASTRTLTFELSGLTAGQSYEVQASFDRNFPSGSTRKYNFDTPAARPQRNRGQRGRYHADRSDGDGNRCQRERQHGVPATQGHDGR